MDSFLQHYLGSTELRYDTRVSPVLAPSFQHLPMTHLFAAECDPVRDENVRYYEQLVSAGVPASIQVYEGMTHGFLWFANRLKIARQALLEGVIAMKKALQA
jgi:acetyl esterase